MIKYKVEDKPEERILEAALDVVAEHTISGTRMHLIAERANMVQSNIHYYYKTKSDLMLALQKKVLKQCLWIREERKRTAKNTIEDQLDVFIEQKKEFILNDQKYDYAELDFWVQGRINPEIEKEFASSFEGWREAIKEMVLEYRPDLEEEKKEYLPYMIVSILEGASVQYLIDKGKFNLDGYFDFCKKIIIKLIME